jgi:hypothetical protein
MSKTDEFVRLLKLVSPPPWKVAEYENGRIDIYDRRNASVFRWWARGGPEQHAKLESAQGLADAYNAACEETE